MFVLPSIQLTQTPRKQRDGRQFFSRNGPFFGFKLIRLLGDGQTLVITISNKKIHRRCFVAPEGRKVISRLAKATGAEPCCGLRIEKLNEAHFGVKMCKATFSEHLWKLRCWKSARRRGGSTCRSQNGKSTHHVRSTFGRSNVIFRDYNCSCDYN